MQYLFINKDKKRNDGAKFLVQGNNALAIIVCNTNILLYRTHCMATWRNECSLVLIVTHLFIVLNCEIFFITKRNFVSLNGYTISSIIYKSHRLYIKSTRQIII